MPCRLLPNPFGIPESQSWEEQIKIFRDSKKSVPMCRRVRHNRELMEHFMHVSMKRHKESCDLTRRDIIKIAAGILAVFEATGIPSFLQASSIAISNRLSPLNRKRPRRPYTKYIVLHTTEGEDGGSLRKLVRFGEAHYFISHSGEIFRIIDKSKIARHAGRSMWEGRSTIDNYSVGIEVSGYHNKDILDAQYTALRELLAQLKREYHISDENVLTHSMVAYGRPNRFHADNHRGRKRCGMIFARPEVRARLGIKSGPKRDRDVQAGRLKVADRELFSYLFSGKTVPAPVPVAADSKTPASASAAIEAPSESSVIGTNRSAWQIARDDFDRASTVYIFPDGHRLNGDQIQDWARVPPGTRVILNETEDPQPFEGFLEIGKDGDTPKAVAGTASTSTTTIYFFPDGLIRTGAELKRRRRNRELLNNPPRGTRLLVGYVYGGYVKTRRPPSNIAGVKWNYPSTYYRYPDGSILSGDDIDAKAIPAGTLVFYQE
jgi:N-acetylmuramoyl-L-alanine amidase